MQTTYENAPATIMLATHCAACGRALVDAPSVEAGMGPDCREKYGVFGELANRAEINQIVHRVAMSQSCSFADAKALHEYGATRILSRLAERFATVFVAGEPDGALTLRSPRYNEALVDVLRRVPRSWDKASKTYRIEAAFAGSLKRAFDRMPGGWGMGRKGPFALGAGTVN